MEEFRALVGRRRHVSRHPAEQKSTAVPRTSCAISSAVSWDMGKPQIGSKEPSSPGGAMRMLDASTGFSTPFKAT